MPMRPWIRRPARSSCRAARVERCTSQRSSPVASASGAAPPTSGVRGVVPTAGVMLRFCRDGRLVAIGRCGAGGRYAASSPAGAPLSRLRPATGGRLRRRVARVDCHLATGIG